MLAKRRFQPIALTAAMVASLLTLSQAQAVNFTWDANGAAIGTGGNGTWDTVTPLWNNGVNTWPAAGTDNDAIFGGTTGTVSIAAGGVTANDLSFTANNYIIQTNTLTLNGSTPTITVGPALTATINSQVSGAAGLVKSGTGTLILTNNTNNYTGGTTISQGTLRTNATGVLGASPVTLGDAGTGSNNIQLTLAANNIANNITVSNNGTGTATIFGQTQFNAHTGNITLNRATTFELVNTGNIDYWYAFANNANVGAISGAGPLTIKGGGGGVSAAGGGNRVLINGNNTYTGGTTIESGQLQIGHVNSLGTGSVTLGNANSGAAVTQLRVGANIANNIIVSASAPGSAAGIGTYNGLQTLFGGLQVDRALTINGASDRLTWSGVNAIWSGAGNITIAGGRVTHDSVANTWTGDMTINAGSIFQSGHAQSLTAANSVINNGTLRLNAVPQTIDGLTGNGTVLNIIGGNTLTVGGGNANAVYNGTFTNGSGTFSLIKAGLGTQTLTGASNYTGTTTVNAGTLLVNNIAGSGLGTGPVVVNAGGTLGGTGAFTGSTTVNTNGILSPGGDGIIESLTTGNLTFANNAIYNYDYLAASSDVTNVTGTLTFGANLTLNLNSLDGLQHAGNYVLFNYTGVDPVLPNFNINFVNGGTAGTSVFVNADTNQVILSLIIPEPATGMLGLMGLSTLLMRRRRVL